MILNNPDCCGMAVSRYIFGCKFDDLIRFLIRLGTSSEGNLIEYRDIWSLPKHFTLSLSLASIVDNEGISYLFCTTSSSQQAAGPKRTDNC